MSEASKSEKQDKLFNMDVSYKTDYPHLMYDATKKVQDTTYVGEALEGDKKVNIVIKDKPVYTSGNPIQRFKYKTVEEITLQSKKYCGQWKNLSPYPNKKSVKTNISTFAGLCILYIILIILAFLILLYFDATYFILTVAGPIGGIAVILLGIYIVIRQNKTKVCEEDVQAKLLQYRNNILERYNLVD